MADTLTTDISAAQNRDAAKLPVGNSPCLVSVLQSWVGIVQDNELLQLQQHQGLL